MLRRVVPAPQLDRQARRWPTVHGVQNVGGQTAHGLSLIVRAGFVEPIFKRKASANQFIEQSV